MFPPAGSNRSPSGTLRCPCRSLSRGPAPPRNAPHTRPQSGAVRRRGPHWRSIAGSRQEPATYECLGVSSSVLSFGVHSLRSRRVDWFHKEPELRERRAGNRFGDAQTNFGGAVRSAAHQPAGADCRTLGELPPHSLLPDIQRPVVDALAERQVLAKPHDVEGGRFLEFQHHFGRGDTIVGRPVGFAPGIQQVLGPEGLVLTADVTGGGFRGLGKIVAERLGQPPAKSGATHSHRWHGLGHDGRAEHSGPSWRPGRHKRNRST